MPATENRYDQVPYQSHPFPQSHPDQLVVLSALLGLPTTLPHQCRVLELGCASGGNIIPMAESMPQATFLGVDASAQQVAEGRACIADLGLTNIDLRQQDILDIGLDIGVFDLIVCHGVFSWVPRPVQEKILAVCKTHLAPNGVAYVSYNTLPGWHLRGLVRDMMLFHTEQFANPAEQASQARSLVAFLVRALEKENTPYSGVLKAELGFLQKQPDYYLLHEHLEENNEPVYFRDFARRATAVGLRYLADANIQTMVPSHFSPDVASTLQHVAADLIHLEQYMDFLRNRTFRQTLLCHADHEPNYQLTPDRVSHLHISAQLEVVASDATSASATPHEFRSPTGPMIGSSDPLVQAALLILSESWPAALHFPDLLARARAGLGGTSIRSRQQLAEDTERLGRAILEFYTAAPNLIDLRVRPALGVPSVSTCPEARPLARWQAERGQLLTNLRHETVQVDAFGREIVRRLDGRTDHMILLDGLVRKTQQGEFTIQRDGRVVTDLAQLTSILRDSLEHQLRLFAKQSLLIR